MTKLTDKELLAGIDEMIDEAPGVGLCTLPFKMIRDGVSDIISERNDLREAMDAQFVPMVPYSERGAETADVLGFIGRFSTDGSHTREQVYDAFLFGGCWWFAFILKSRFEREYPCQIVIDYVRNHFACRINDTVYDITGRVDGGTWESWDLCDDEVLKERITADCIMF